METQTILIKGQIPSKSNSYMPVIKGKGKKSRACLIKKKELRKWETEFQAQLFNYPNPKIIGHFEMTLVVYFQSWASDLDGCLKGVLDCIQSVGWIKNDRDCAVLSRLEKRVDSVNPRLYFKLKTIEQ